MPQRLATQRTVCALVTATLLAGCATPPPKAVSSSSATQAAGGSGNGAAARSTAQPATQQVPGYANANPSPSSGSSGRSTANPGASSAAPATGADEDKSPCSVVASAAGGAVAGALLGALLGGKKGALKGAAIGAAGAGALCALVKLNSKQTKTAEQVNRDYQVRHGGNLSAEPSLVSAYAPTMSGNGTVQRGGSIKVATAIEVADGRNTPVRSIAEQVVLVDEEGNTLASDSKGFTSNSAGRYENQFEIGMPAQAPQGRYAVRTQLIVNGKAMASREMKTQVVWNGQQAFMVAMQ